MTKDEEYMVVVSIRHYFEDAALVMQKGVAFDYYGKTTRMEPCSCGSTKPKDYYYIDVAEDGPPVIKQISSDFTYLERKEKIPVDKVYRDTFSPETLKDNRPADEIAAPDDTIGDLKDKVKDLYTASSADYDRIRSKPDPKKILLNANNIRM